MFLSSNTCTSNVKYFLSYCNNWYGLKSNRKLLTFFMTMTKKGSLMPKVFFELAGQVMYVVLTFVPMSSSTEL